ncbi:uncharacterized protein BO80DRAFT_503 [Aspergillus ibericus CBS 121593]|uniref:Uncharacterized protein n=1 Tax=Aspergillus ibericus CBS 121593 TaxID=1448316 RepID=A0A395HGF4_9EURO|nr:hypothetical protein BO80DRAFT_503 [Aspergillus ibericus CBS 121593]RAL06068.1 hypothetical protein BO80DRAFT_503 [Aspergillus ibericus CBS 121593]
MRTRGDGILLLHCSLPLPILASHVFFNLVEGSPTVSRARVAMFGVRDSIFLIADSCRWTCINSFSLPSLLFPFLLLSMKPVPISAAQQDSLFCRFIFLVLVVYVLILSSYVLVE